MEWKYFSIETIVYTNEDSLGYLRMKCRVSPYHDYQEGVKFSVFHKGDFDIKNKTEDYLQPVTTSDTLEFIFDFKKLKPGISVIYPKFKTINPFAGVPSGGDVGNSGDVLKEKMRLFIGYDDDMSFLFITDRPPINIYIQRQNMHPRFKIPDEHLIQMESDPRVTWIKNLSKLPENRWIYEKIHNK